MKTTAILFLAYLALCVQCSVPENKSTKKEISTQPIKVVYSMGMEEHRPVFGKLSPLSGWTRKWRYVPLLQQI